MFSRIKRLLDLEKQFSDPIVKAALEKAAAEQEKLKLYKTLVKQPFQYDIIRDFINAASHGVVVRFTIDGIPIEIRRDEQAKPNRGPDALF